MEGWIKSYRAIMENPIVCKDAEYFAVWGYILHYAAHTVADSYFDGKRIEIQPGQLITGRKKIAEKFKISESKVYRILKVFQNEQQIEQRTSNASSLITVVNWRQYQANEQQIEQQLNNQRTTTEQQLNTIQECKNDKNTHTQFFPSTNLSRTREEISSRAQGLLKWIEVNTPTVQMMELPITPKQAQAIVDRIDDEDTMRVFQDMCNKGATKRCRSAINTFNSYASRDFILKEKREKQQNRSINQEAIQRGFVKK